MNVQINPFLNGRLLDSVEGLVGRDTELEEILGCVRSGQAVMVYSPRRYGKTSLARVVEGRARGVWDPRRLRRPVGSEQYLEYRERTGTGLRPGFGGLPYAALYNSLLL
jgi:hypothetical protein